MAVENDGSSTTRNLSWGGGASRALMQQLADDMADRAEFQVCAIEVVRPGELLEFVAIAGDDHYEELLGTGSPLGDMLMAVEDGEMHGPFCFVSHEAMRPETRELLRTSGVVPDVPASDDPGAYHPWDLLFALVRDDQEELRALVYLDLPHDRRRRTPEQLERLGEELELPLRSVLTVAEREEFAHHVRVIRATRRLIRSGSSRHDVDQLLREAHATLSSTLGLEAMDIQLFDSAPADSLLGLDLPPEVHAAVVDSARRAWRQQSVVIIEPEGIWNDEQLKSSYAEVFRTALAVAGYAAVVIAPIGVEDEALGMLLAARTPGSRRWNDGEGEAIIELGHDLGRVIANAHATQRERALLAELRKLELERRELINVVIHEVNNPLTVISANAELLAALPGLPEAAASRVAAIQRGADRLGELAADLDDLFRATGRDRPPEEAVDLCLLVRECGDAMRAVAQRRQVRLAVAVPDDAVVVRGDARDLRGVITNLVDNAVKYSDPGDQVSITLASDGTTALLTVQDDGIGISPWDQAELGRAMFRSTNPDALRRPGTGLGLGIVQRIVAAHEGHLTLESELGVGTTVRVELPVG